MKRDMDLIREMLMQLETKGQGFGPVQLELPKYDDAVVRYHAGLLLEAGLARGQDVTTMQGPDFDLYQLTWAGHEFLDASREPTRWQKAKSIFDRVGGMTFAALLDVLEKLIVDQSLSALSQ